MAQDQVNLGLLILRVAVGATMIAHGFNHIYRGGKITGTGRWFESLGMKPGILHAWLASVTELVGRRGARRRPAHAARGGRVRGRDARRVRSPTTARTASSSSAPGEGWEYVMNLAVALLRDRVPRPG